MKPKTRDMTNHAKVANRLAREAAERAATHGTHHVAQAHAFALLAIQHQLARIADALEFVPGVITQEAEDLRPSVQERLHSTLAEGAVNVNIHDEPPGFVNPQQAFQEGVRWGRANP